MRRNLWYVVAGAVAIVLASVAIYLTVRHFRNSQAALFAHAATSTAANYASAGFVSIPPTLGITTHTPAVQGMKRYFDQSHHFTLEYPQDLQVSTFPSEQGAIVITFKNSATDRGFQIFATPYDQPKITQQTFELDEPSGVMLSPQDLTIEGAPATAFYSQDQTIGDTFEIWFLNSGILYEVTTSKQLDTWLMQIMATWNFV